MTARAAVAAILACATLAVGCGSKAPDYQSLWTTSGTTTSTPIRANPVPLGKYLEDEGVRAEPVAPDKLTDLTVSIPTPPGWSKQKNPKLPPTTLVIGKGDKFPRAILMVLKLSGDFDVGEAVTHSVVDLQLTPNFRQLDGSTADFDGFKSEMVQGSHDLDGQRVHSWFRMVIPTGSPPANQRYLVQLSIVTLADQAAKQAADVEAIMKGFTVAAK
ncbi:MAG TPA: LpqN/LpqT family lipoprotein [Mycobacterium sp.]|nr:LpqN/LpqT family lipoprotein [Mycobacterium sp.]